MLSDHAKISELPMHEKSIRLKYFPSEVKINEVFIKFIEALMHTPYEVIIQNGCDDDLVDLTVTFYLNKLIGNVIQPTGPFTKSLAALPAGKQPGFRRPRIA